MIEVFEGMSGEKVGGRRVTLPLTKKGAPGFSFFREPGAVFLLGKAPLFLA